jgi:hypothetical protein
MKAGDLIVAYEPCFVMFCRYEFDVTEDDPDIVSPGFLMPGELALLLKVIEHDVSYDLSEAVMLVGYERCYTNFCDLEAKAQVISLECADGR